MLSDESKKIIQPLNIKIDLNIKLGDIAVKNKRKIKLKRNINGKIETTTFIFNLETPYVVFIGAGDCKDQEYGNLIIKLNLPNKKYLKQKKKLFRCPEKVDRKQPRIKMYK